MAEMCPAGCGNSENSFTSSKCLFRGDHWWGADEQAELLERASWNVQGFVWRTKWSWPGRDDPPGSLPCNWGCASSISAIEAVTMGIDFKNTCLP